MIEAAGCLKAPGNDFLKLAGNLTPMDARHWSFKSSSSGVLMVWGTSQTQKESWLPALAASAVWPEAAYAPYPTASKWILCQNTTDGSL